MGRITKLGILGGTFDPPHYGHLIMAQAVCDHIDLDLVLWAPASSPPHKLDQSYVPIQHRLEMVKLAISRNKKFKLSLVDVNRPGPHYTIDMLQYLVENYQLAEFYLILGSDSLNDIPMWQRPDEIVRQAQLAVVTRSDYPIKVSNLVEKIPGLFSRVVQIPCPQVAISSTYIRETIAQGRSIRYLLPDRVSAYIQKHHLYQA